MTTRQSALYARYSDKEQDRSSTIESQIRECREYAQHHGLAVVEDFIFIDRALRGTTVERRDGFKAMIAAAQRTPRPFDAILVWKFSRFARNREDSALYKGLLRRRGVEVISVTEPIDRHSASGILTEGLIETVDQFYSARLAEDVRRGQTQTALDGFSTGGCPPYGYRRVEVPDPHGRRDRTGEPVVRVRFEVDPVEAPIVLRIFQTYAASAGYKKIVLALNREHIPGPRGGTWDLSAVREMLRNDAYRGIRAYGRTEKVRTAHGTRSKRNKPADTWIVKVEAHPAIISQDLWDRVREKRERVNRIYRENGMAQAQLAHSRYLLTGILYCAHCGGHFVIRGGYRTKAGLSRHYACGRRTNRGADVCANRTHLPQQRIERELLDLLMGKVLTPANLERLLASVNAALRAQAAEARPRIKEVKRGLALVDRQIANFVRAVGQGNFTPLEAALGESQTRRDQLQAELARLEQAQPTGMLQLTPAALKENLEMLIEDLRGGDPGRVRAALERSLGRIIVGVDGTMAMELKPKGLLGVETTTVPLGCRGDGTHSLMI